MKHVKIFKKIDDYNIYKSDLEHFIIPNVSFVEETEGVFYKTIQSISNATITCDSATYDGQSHIATNIVVTLYGETLINGVDYTVSGNNGGTNAGDYTFMINGIGSYIDSKQGTFTINKAQGEVTIVPTAITGLIPTGSAQALVNAGSGTGTMMYNLNGGAWSSSIPTATNAGSYTVGYKVAESTYYTESTTGSVIVAINDIVDLGLPSGTKWATMNVGANSETDYGNYYQYGKGAAQYAETYDATGEESYYTGTEDPLAASVDTVTQVWGGSWHIPTKTQFEELIANTTYTWETDFNGSGVNGAKFTAQNGNYVFFAAAGIYSHGEQSGVGDLGNYWSSTPNSDFGAYYLYIMDDYNAVGDFRRDDGYTVRGVIG